MLHVDAIEALTALAVSSSVEGAERAAESVRSALGEDAAVLEPLLRSLVARVSEVGELQRLAGTDPLTGVAHRRVFEDALTRELARHARSGSGLAVVLLDLDDLKAINDRYGHAAGDRAIVALTRVASSCLRATDMIARLGGDEFALLLPGADEEGALEVAGRIRDAAAAVPVADAMLRVSVGVAAAAEASTAAGLVALADCRLYADKRVRKSLLPRALRASEQQSPRPVLAAETHASAGAPWAFADWMQR